MSLKNYVKKVECLSPRDTVFTASRAMRAHGIGAVIVISDDHKPIGILTDRDIAIRVVAEQRDPMWTPLEHAMTRNVVYLSEDSTIRAVTELMRDHGIRRIPICDAAGHVTGLIALDDILLLLGMEMGNLATALASEAARPEADVIEPPLAETD